jgi:hypothetical protein
VDVRRVPMGAAVEALNLYAQQGRLRTRPPRRVHGDAPAIGVRALCEYQRRTMDPAVRLLAVCDNDLYASDVDGQLFTDPLKLDCLVATDHPVRFQQDNDVLYFVDGTNYVRRWFGGTAIGSVHRDVGDGPAPQIDEASRYDDDTLRMLTVTITTAGGRGDGVFSWQFSEMGTGGSGVYIAETTVLHYGITLRWPNDAFVEGDVFKVRCTPADFIDSLEDPPTPAKPPAIEVVNAPETILTPNTLSVYGAGPTASFTPAVRAEMLDDVDNFNGDATADFAKSPDVFDICARRFTDPGHYLTGTSAIGIEFLMYSIVGGAHAWGWLKQDWAGELDLSLTSSVEVTFQIVSGTQIGVLNSRLYLQFGAPRADDKLAHIVEFDLTGIQPNEWVTLSADISSIDVDDRKAIDYVALAFYSDMAQPVQRLELVEESGGLPHTYTPDCTLALTFLVDRLGPADPNTLLGTGTYEVRTSLGVYDGLALVEGAPTRAIKVEVKDEQIGWLRVTQEVTAEAGLTTNDKVYIYMRGGAAPEFMRIATIPGVVGHETYEHEWDGTVETDSEILDAYIGSPPKGCSVIGEHRNRVLYAKDDALYIANLGDPTRVPQEALLLMYDQYGGTQRIGRDGGAITALGVLGTMTLIFKAHSITSLTGQFANDIAFLPVHDKYGTQSAESVQTVRGAVVWLDTSGTVCQFDGQTIREVGALAEGYGCPIAPALRAIPAEDRADAFAVVDPANRYYLLVIPTHGAWLYQVDTNGWWTWANVPEGCAVRAPHADTPGIYAGSPASATIYRLIEEGPAVTDEGAIPWRWISGAIPLESDYDKDVRYLRVTSPPQSTGTMVLRVYQDGDTVIDDDPAYNNIATSRTLALDGHAQVTWAPPPLVSTPVAQIGVSGSGERVITAIDIDIIEKGRVR